MCIFFNIFSIFSYKIKKHLDEVRAMPVVPS